jgi:hypothetical protein
MQDTNGTLGFGSDWRVGNVVSPPRIAGFGHPCFT